MTLQVGVKAVVKNNEGKILLVRRSFQKYGEVEGEWDIPGGRILVGTLLIDNLFREVQEETNLKVLGTPKLVAAQDILRGSEKHVVRLTYIAHVEGEVVLDLSENEEYAWVSIEELLDRSGDPSLDRYIRALLKEKILTADSFE